MRERTTWNRPEILRQAGMPKQADPYLMNQDHVSKNPPADKYVTGDPSTFAEDVAPNDWAVEYAGGTTKRDEIGMPEVRKDTFSHPEKTASEALLIKKANLTVATARLMLRGTKFASEEAREAAIEDQALALMHMPDAALIETNTRLADQSAFPGGEFPTAAQPAQGQPAQGQPGQQDQQQAAVEQTATGYEQAAAAVQDKVQSLVEQAMKEQAQQAPAAPAQDPAQVTARAKLARAMKANDPVAAEAAINEMAATALASLKKAEEDKKEQQQVATAPVAADPPAQGQPAKDQEQAAQTDQPAPQGQPAQDQQQAAVQQTADDMLLDEMLMDQAAPGEMGDIEMEASPMDVGEMPLGPEDDVLTTLFASNQEVRDAKSVLAQQGQGDDAEQQAQQAEQQAQQAQAKQAMSRTASTRTVGTQPRGGVSRIGGAPAVKTASGDIDKLSSLWASAPDVREVFGVK